MKEDIRYIADDGTVFSTKHVCQDYEQAIKIIEAANTLHTLCKQRFDAIECIRCPLSCCCASKQTGWFIHTPTHWNIDSIKEKFYDRFRDFKKEGEV